jgi:hypothetical protein
MMKQRASLLTAFALLTACQPKTEGRANAKESRDESVKPALTIAEATLEVPPIVPISVTLALAGGNCEVRKVSPDPARVPINALVHFKYVNGCNSKKKLRVEKKLQDILDGDCRSNKDVEKFDPANVAGTVVDAFCTLMNVQQGTRYPYAIDGDVKKDPEIDVQGPGPFGTPEPSPTP